MSEKKRNFREGWWIRKAIYVVVAVAGVVATGFGVVSTEQVDAITASPVLATVVGLIAASFTNRGSDSPVTEADVEVGAVCNRGESFGGGGAGRLSRSTPTVSMLRGL